jgi:hypothetical protein
MCNILYKKKAPLNFIYILQSHEYQNFWQKHKHLVTKLKLTKINKKLLLKFLIDSLQL